ncbi:hypothetical protein C2845_PMPSC032374 [Panicum miliaceum]|uniref:Uncharacterized protein n=1 Tax=Panicum miliaceum TaxID=4540 RepID=A0A3L6P9R2_PANMI|nr:hypothetical protein C2845_PMPSC032374 [Panicum miliaceum]
MEHSPRKRDLIVFDFDWEYYDYEVFAEKIIKDEGLPEDEKEKIKEFLKEKVKQRKIELKQAEEARKKAFEDMDPKTREAFESIKFYKFYPVKTEDTPDVDNIVKSRYNQQILWQRALSDVMVFLISHVC